MSNEDKWIENLTFVQDYIDEHHKKPQQTNKDPEIKKLGAWIKMQ